MELLKIIRKNPIMLSIFYDIQQYNTLSSLFKLYSYATISTILKRLEEIKLIERKIEGRRKVIYYTDKGLLFLKKIQELNNILVKEEKVE